MKISTATMQLISESFRDSPISHSGRELQRGCAGAVASWIAAVLRRFANGIHLTQSARGVAQSKTWRRHGRAPQNESAFTMIEIAICLAIIGISLVAIIGVLPMGLNVQKDNREETIINQDATVFMEYIRNGARGADDLTNYVYAITNFQTKYNPGPALVVPTPGWDNNTYLTYNARIIGLMSTPEYVDGSGHPIPNLSYANPSYYSNYIVAYVRSVSGPASEKPPQDNNGTVRMDSFSYKIICENVPVAVDTNSLNSPYNKQLTANLHELRLTFLWPLLPNGKTGGGRQTFRTMVAGQIVQTSDTSVTPNQQLYFFQPQSFTNVSAP